LSKTNLNKIKAAKTKKELRTKLAKELERKPHVEHNDLCSTCSATPECINRTPGMPVHYCEEYDEHPPVASPRSPQPAQPVADPPDVQGLCINCEHRHTCTTAATQGGIWHCEEFA